MKDPDGDGVYEFSTDKLPAGNYAFKVAHNRSWAENYGAGGVRDGADIPLTVAAGKVVRFKYTLATHLVDVTFTNSDVTPPTTTVALNPDQPDWTGGFSSPVTVTLTGADESPGTVAVEYRLDGGQWTAYTAPLVVSTPGAHTVDVRATDATGNVSPVVVSHVHDRDAPEHRPRRGRGRPGDARGAALGCGFARHVRPGRRPRLHGRPERGRHQHRR